MDSKIVVMIVQLAMPNGDGSYEVRPMADVETCIAAAEIEASDPFVHPRPESQAERPQIRSLHAPSIESYRKARAKEPAKSGKIRVETALPRAATPSRG